MRRTGGGNGQEEKERDRYTEIAMNGEREGKIEGNRRTNREEQREREVG